MLQVFSRSSPQACPKGNPTRLGARTVPALGAQGLQDIPVTPAALPAGCTARSSLGGRAQSPPQQRPRGVLPCDRARLLSAPPHPSFCDPFEFSSSHPCPGSPPCRSYLRADTQTPPALLSPSPSMVRTQEIALAPKRQREPRAVTDPRGTNPACGAGLARAGRAKTPP